jgi:hypothetical protein
MACNQSALKYWHSFTMINQGFQGMEQNRVRFLLAEKNKALKGRNFLNDARVRVTA